MPADPPCFTAYDELRDDGSTQTVFTRADGATIYLRLSNGSLELVARGFEISLPYGQQTGKSLEAVRDIRVLLLYNRLPPNTTFSTSVALILLDVTGHTGLYSSLHLGGIAVWRKRCQGWYHSQKALGQTWEPL